MQQEYALAQMQKQYDYWKQQTDYMNAYNDPSALLARWRSAGVTPSGVLGQSGVSVSGNSASGPGSSGQGIGAAGMDVQNSLGALGSGITVAAAAYATDAYADADDAADAAAYADAYAAAAYAAYATDADADAYAAAAAAAYATDCKADGNRYWFIDCLGTSGQYMIIDDKGEVSIKS